MKVTRIDQASGDETYFVSGSGKNEHEKPEVKEIMDFVDGLVVPTVRELAGAVTQCLPSMVGAIYVMHDKEGRVATVQGTQEPEIQIKALKRAIELLEAMKHKKEN